MTDITECSLLTDILAALGGAGGGGATAANQVLLNALIGEVQASPTANTLLARLKSIEGYVDGIEGYVDGIETLITSSNTKLDTLHTDLGTTLAGYLDGVETALGAVADAAWTSGSGSEIALLKAIAGAAISTNPVQIYRSDSFANITTKTTTTVKSGAGTLSRIIISPGTADTLTIYDNTAASGTLIGTITIGATANLTLEFGCAFATGLTIVSGGTTAGNYTVIYR